MSAARAFLEGVKHVFKKTFTLKHPYQRHELPDGYRGRHLLYMDRCIGCGICAWICPEKCITLVPVTDEKTYPRNPEKRFPQYWYIRCCFCHFCTDYCPTGAPSHTQQGHSPSCSPEPQSDSSLCKSDRSSIGCTSTAGTSFPGSVGMSSHL
ncbi:4Fe-4S binding protein [[Eubacterium] cellulosolvens]